MSFASDFKAAIREETDEELRRMAEADDMLGAIARGEIGRRERERTAALFAPNPNGVSDDDRTQ